MHSKQGNVITDPLLIATHQMLAAVRWLNINRKPNWLTVGEPVNLPFDPSTSISNPTQQKWGHLASTNNEGKWGSDAWKCLKCLIYLIVGHLLLGASCGQPPRGSVSFRGESSMSQLQKILLLFNGCDMIDSLELLSPWPWRTGAQTEVSILCGCETVAQQSSLILMQLFVCLCFVFSD